MNSKNRDIKDLNKGIKEVKRGHQLRHNFVKDENGDLLPRFSQHFEQVEDLVLSVVERTEGHYCLILVLFFFIFIFGD
jgi:hypothetical protein